MRSTVTGKELILQTVMNTYKEDSATQKRAVPFNSSYPINDAIPIMAIRPLVISACSVQGVNILQMVECTQLTYSHNTSQCIHLRNQKHQKTNQFTVMQWTFSSLTCGVKGPIASDWLAPLSKGTREAMVKAAAVIRMGAVASENCRDRGEHRTSLSLVIQAYL